VFAPVVLKAWKMGKTLKVSTELLADAFFNIEGYAAEMLGRAFGIAEEDKFIAGASSQNFPTGILVSGALGVTCLDDVPTMDEIIELFYSVNANERRQPGCGWILGNDFVCAARKLKSDEGQYLWQPSTQLGQPDMLLGKPVYESGSCPTMEADAIVGGFGNIKKYVIADRQGRTLLRLNELYSANGQVGFQLTQRVDGKLLQADAFKTIKMGDGNLS